MSNFSDFIGGGGGGGAQIDEIKFFVDKGETFTDDSGYVWLRNGHRLLDTTPYPDASSQVTPVCKTTDYQSNQYVNSASTFSVNEDNNWYMVRSQYDSDRYYVVDMDTDTKLVDNGQVPSTYGTDTDIMCMAYVKCTGSPSSSSITQADNTFVVGVCREYGTINLHKWSLNDSSGSQAGRLQSSQGRHQLFDHQSTSLSSTFAGIYDDWSIFWHQQSRTMYLLCVNNLYTHLYRYDMSAYNFGHNSFSAPSSWVANERIDWGTQMQSALGNSDYEDDIITMSADSTHFYAHYYHRPTGEYRMRKIPISGNRSWASGSDVSGAFYDDVGESRLLLQNSSGTFSNLNTDTTVQYYKTDGDGTEKYLTFTSSSPRMYEFSADNDVLGQKEWDYRRSQTAYQRIK